MHVHALHKGLHYTCIGLDYNVVFLHARQAECTGKGETVPTLRSGPLHSILYVCVDGEVRVRGAFKKKSANWIRQTVKVYTLYTSEI